MEEYGVAICGSVAQGSTVGCAFSAVGPLPISVLQTIPASFLFVGCIGSIPSANHAAGKAR